MKISLEFGDHKIQIFIQESFSSAHFRDRCTSIPGASIWAMFWQRRREIETLKAISSAWWYGSYDISYPHTVTRSKGLKSAIWNYYLMLAIVYPPKATPPKQTYWIVFEYTNSILGFTYRPVTDSRTFAYNLWNSEVLQSKAFAGKCAVATTCTRTPIDGQHGSASESWCRQRESQKSWGKFPRNLVMPGLCFWSFWGSRKFYIILLIFACCTSSGFGGLFLNIKIIFRCVEDVPNCCHCPCFLNFWTPNFWPFCSTLRRERYFKMINSQNSWLKTTPTKIFTGAVVGAVGAVSAIGRAGANLTSTLVLWMRTWDIGGILLGSTGILETTWNDLI